MKGDIMDITGRSLIGIFLAFVLIGIFVWFDHSRAIDCRTTAQSAGASVADAVKLCKR